MDNPSITPNATPKSAVRMQLTVAVAIIIIFLAIVVIYKKVHKSTEVADSNTAQTSEMADASGTSMVGTNNTSTNNAGNANTGVTSSSEDTSAYKDGSYEATGSYTSPGGREELKVAVTIRNGLIADAAVTSLANNPESKEYQNKFISGYKNVVIGKSISSLKLSKVSGSSLTPRGFNDAISQIKAQAS